MKDEEKRRLLGVKEGERLPTFGRRGERPPASGDPASECNLTDFRDEARSILQQGRERSDAERAEAKAAGRKASILNLIRRKRGRAEPEPEETLSEEEEWNRRMSAADSPDDTAE